MISLSLRNLAYARIPLWRTNCIECHARIPFWAAIFLTWPPTPTVLACLHPALPACLLCLSACLLPVLLPVCGACLCSPACLHCLHACLHLPGSMSAPLPACQFACLKSGYCMSMHVKCSLRKGCSGLAPPNLLWFGFASPPAARIALHPTSSKGCFTPH